MLVLDVLPSFFVNLQRNFGIFECCSIWTSQFLPIQEKDGKMEAGLPIFPPTHYRVGKLGFYGVRLILCFVRLRGQSFRHGMFVGKRGDPIYGTINLHI